IIEIDIENINKNKLIKLREIKYFDISFYKSDNINKYKNWMKKLKEIKPWIKHHYSIFIKLDIPFILKDLDNVLFLDADMLVLSSVSKFFEFDMSNYSLLVIQNDQKCLYWINEEFENWMKEIGLRKRDYFGSSILFFNIKNIREKQGIQNIEKLSDECFEKYMNIIFTDEHILYYIYRKMTVYVDFNLHISLEWPEYAKKFDQYDIKVLNYAGLSKPLSLNNNGNIDDKYMIFWQYFSETPFFKENYFKYMNIFASNSPKKEINKLREAINKIVDIIVYPIPFRKIRKSIRSKINNILNS
ncbi:glycosyltransferase, partial [uncultured Brachyspira sp.]